MEQNEKHKPIEELNVMDDFLFNEIVMDERYGEIFIHYFLKTVLGNDVKVRDVTAQLIYTSGDPNKRAIRMDVLMKGTLLPKEINPVTGKRKETFVDIEMQSQSKYTKGWNKENLRNRSRLYQALLDANLLKAGQYFGEIPNSLIIFCMPFDLFNRDRIMYSFEYYCKEEPELALEDGAMRIFLNTKGTIGGRKELRDMLRYIEDSSEKNVVSQELEKIHNLVNEVRKSKKVGDKYMLAIMREMEIREEGRSEGIEALILDNLEENISKERILQKLQKRFNLSNEEAKKQFELYSKKAVV